MSVRYDSPSLVFDQVTGHNRDHYLRLAATSPNLFWAEADTVYGRSVDAQTAMAVCWYVSVMTGSAFHGFNLLESWKASPTSIIPSGAVVPERDITMSNKEVLTKLAGDADWKVRRFVARNLDTPKGVLVKLSGDVDWRVRCSVAYNPNTPKEVLAKLAEDTSRIIRCFVARNPDGSKEVLAKLAGDADWNVRRFVARNPNASKETLAKLAGDANWKVREWVACNPSTSKETLAELATDTDWDVRARCDPSMSEV